MTHDSAVSPAPIARRRARGFVLVLAMLVLLVLSGMGIFGLRTSRIELRGATNTRLGATAEYVAEAAMQQALNQLVTDPTKYVGYVTGGASYTMPFVAGVFNENSTTFDTFGPSQGVMPQWSVVLSRAIDVSPSALTGTMIGSVGGTTARFRMKRIDVTATGTIAPRYAVDGGVTAGLPVTTRSATVQVRAHVVMGPM